MKLGPVLFHLHKLVRDHHAFISSLSYSNVSDIWDVVYLDIFEERTIAHSIRVLTLDRLNFMPRYTS